MRLGMGGVVLCWRGRRLYWGVPRTYTFVLSLGISVLLTRFISVGRGFFGSMGNGYV